MNLEGRLPRIPWKQGYEVRRLTAARGQFYWAEACKIKAWFHGIRGFKGAESTRGIRQIKTSTAMLRYGWELRFASTDTVDSSSFFLSFRKAGWEQGFASIQ